MIARYVTIPAIVLAERSAASFGGRSSSDGVTRGRLVVCSVHADARY